MAFAAATVLESGPIGLNGEVLEIRDYSDVGLEVATTTLHDERLHRYRTRSTPHLNVKSMDCGVKPRCVVDEKQRVLNVVFLISVKKNAIISIFRLG
jgi:hypothetical protein